MDAGTLYGLGIALVFAGMLVILVAIILLFLSSVRGEGKVRGGGAIIIGPFPIIFGTDKESVKMVLLLSIILVVLLAMVTVIFYLMFR
ncbi:MAG: TIGR00304 family membrane protein [Candidatus Bathyarchaeales archaeon]